MTDLFYQRYSREPIKTALTDTPVVFIVGPRQSGKTTLVKSLIDDNWQYVTLDNQTQLTIATTDPVSFIQELATKQAAIDEIQRQPQLLIAIKQMVDENRRPGHFLLTGSANALVLPQVADSLAGRVETITLNTLSETEIQQTTPSFLKKLMASQTPIANDTRIKDYLVQRIVTGCFPDAIKRSNENRVSTWYKQYLNALIEKDIKDIAQIEHPEKMSTLLKLTTHYSGKLINFSEIGSKINLNKNTTKKYLALLQQLFLIKKLPAWHSNSYKRLTKTPKLHFSDTGIVCAIKNINRNHLLKQPEEVGSLLESFVYNELEKQAAWLEEELTFYHYRDKDKIEVDYIIENAAGEYFAIEVKASATLTQKDFVGLKHFKKITEKQFKLGILLYDGDHTTAFGEGLFAVPLGALWS